MRGRPLDGGLGVVCSLLSGGGDGALLALHKPDSDRLSDLRRLIAEIVQIGHELQAMSQWLDEHCDLLGSVTRDLVRSASSSPVGARVICGHNPFPVDPSEVDPG